LERSIKQYDVVCITAAKESEQRRVAALCRKHGKKFIAADAHGFFAIMWLDLLEHE
jgi:molybdopterin/thiamine biosynthesis adenylyltransferase